MNTHEVIFLPTGRRAYKGDIIFFGDKYIIASSVLHLAKESYDIHVLSNDEIKNVDADSSNIKLIL
jgi:hypothetical protein